MRAQSFLKVGKVAILTQFMNLGSLTLCHIFVSSPFLNLDESLDQAIPSVVIGTVEPFGN